MGVATEADLGAAGGEVAPGIVGVEHIAPGCGCAGIRVDIKPILVIDPHRQHAEIGAGIGIKAIAGPFDGDAGIRGHRLRRLARGLVMVTAHGERAVLDQPARLVEAPFGIGAIADDVAEQDDAIGAIAGNGVEAGVEGLAVGMDVGQKRNQHGLGVSSSHSSNGGRRAPFAGGMRPHADREQPGRFPDPARFSRAGPVS
jgi:hypothetical protein